MKISRGTKEFKIVFVFMAIICCGAQNVFAQWYLDTATPEEAAARDKPYLYLRNEIQSKICDENLGIEKNNFKLLEDDPGWRKIVRGTGIYRFDCTGGGDGCLIMPKPGSALYQKINDEEIESGKKMMEKKYAFNSPEYKLWDKTNKQLQNEKEFAQINMVVNDDRIQGKELQSFRTFREEQLHNIPGVQQAILYSQLPDEDNPDTSYRVALYIGNFPKYSGKMEAVHFQSATTSPWKDKQHSGKPVVENISVWIYAHHYQNLMKVIRSINWSGLKQMVKN